MSENARIPLFKRLGIRPFDRLLILNPPEDYPDLLQPLPPGIEFARDLQTPMDFLQYFARSRRELAQAFPGLRMILALDGALWISWPKSDLPDEFDLNEHIIREIGSGNGLVDEQVVDIDEDWQALKFVHPT